MTGGENDNHLYKNTRLTSALAKYEKQFQSLPYSCLPHDLSLDAVRWDLSQWTLVIGDQCLIRLSRYYEGSKVLDLNLSGASKITDKGILALLDSVPNLKTVSLENVFQITDKALAKIVTSCKRLVKICLSGCLGISGKGFAILGQFAQNLVTLKVSGCRQISQWSFMKIFEGCKLLEELDTSYCSNLTDQEVQILANCCVRLRHVNLKECCQVSDVGILSLAQSCTLMDYISLSRNDLVYRVTDVTLMAIGENCKHLKTISLSGCSKISDAGISWLAKGCKILNYVNLSGCTNITNSGVRYLGDECNDLRTLIITNAKKISDVGIRYIGKGCHQLETLNVSGVYKISDGVKRNFAHEGLQSLGAAKCAKHIKRLNLQGCFQLSHSALKAIAMMNSLEYLIFAGCTKLAISGLTPIAKSCLNISYISFAACGDCISNEIIQIITQNLKCLRSLILSDCQKINRKALISISRCSQLHHLNLAGCKNVTNEAILELCDGSYAPGLKELFIERCTRLDDKALLWIVDGLYSPTDQEKVVVTLTTLSMHGTKITLSSAKAIKERFKYSSLKVNNSFFGFWPLSRVEDRTLINHHYNTAKSAIKLQSIFRSMKGRQYAKQKRARHKITKKSTLIAALWRGRVARKMVKEWKQNLWLRKVSTIKLQCFFRCFLARNNVRKMKGKRWMIVAPYAATRIQKTFRAFKGRKKSANERKMQILLHRKKINKSVLIQSIIRRHLAIQMKDRIQMENTAVEKLQLRSCIKLQSIFRMKLAAINMDKLKTELLKVLAQRAYAASCIARSMRLMTFRAQIQKRVMYKNRLKRMAIQIQSWYHRRIHLQREKAQKVIECDALQLKSAIILEKNWRRKCAYNTAKTLMKEIMELNKSQHEKAFILTSWSRVCIARLRVKLLRKEKIEFLELRFKIESQAAILIESCWRGHQGRLKASEVLKTKKFRWKQMWSDEYQRRFFYNQITGESRWRKPQDLLDLDPKPICNNCDYYEAKLECANCLEYFCSSCWDAVHFGGKRKDHTFRSLFDFYGRRVDYKNEEFPSVWPSEIEQDDILGWQLRN